jgi:hypothetical protein
LLMASIPNGSGLELPVPLLDAVLQLMAKAPNVALEPVKKSVVEAAVSAPAAAPAKPDKKLSPKEAAAAASAASAAAAAAAKAPKKLAPVRSCTIRSVLC